MRAKPAQKQIMESAMQARGMPDARRPAPLNVADCLSPGGKLMAFTRCAAAVTVRRLSPAERPIAFPVISQLRSLDEATFLRHVGRQSYAGCELVGAFMDGELIGLLGMRPVHTLARGAFLCVDDLVVDENHRGSGAGHTLMDYAETDARARNMNWVFLDAKPEAVTFYERRDYVLHPAPSMKKAL